jgi:hypothetical protein
MRPDGAGDAGAGGAGAGGAGAAVASDAAPTAATADIEGGASNAIGDASVLSESAPSEEVSAEDACDTRQYAVSIMLQWATQVQVARGWRAWKKAVQGTR